jgi:hypothetical protein
MAPLQDAHHRERVSRKLGGRKEMCMRRKLAALALGVLFALAAASPALADQPPGQLGYEGQPGNQGGGGGGPAPGLLGYEGQPGNQGGP